MAWPLKYRVLSSVIVIAVVMMESAVALLPIGFALWLFAGLKPLPLVRDLTFVAVAASIVIAIYGDVGRHGFRSVWRIKSWTIQN
jgi:hypothetical protein